MVINQVFHGDLPVKNGDFPCNYHRSLGIGISSARIGILCGPSRSDRPHGAAGAGGPVRVEVSEVRSAAQQVSMVCWEVHGSHPENRVNYNHTAMG